MCDRLFITCNTFLLKINLLYLSNLKPPLHCTSFCFSFFKRYSIYWVISTCIYLLVTANLTSTCRRYLYLINFRQIKHDISELSCKLIRINTAVTFLELPRFYMIHYFYFYFYPKNIYFWLPGTGII